MSQPSLLRLAAMPPLEVVSFLSMLRAMRRSTARFFWSFTLSHSSAVLTEGDIEHPVDAPVPTGLGEQGLGWVRQAGDVVADLPGRIAINESFSDSTITMLVSFPHSWRSFT